MRIEVATAAMPLVVIALDGWRGRGGVLWVKNLLVAEIGRWLHPDAVCVNSEQTAYVIAKIDESKNKHSILEDDTSEGEYKDVNDTDST